MEEDYPREEGQGQEQGGCVVVLVVRACLPGQEQEQWQRACELLVLPQVRARICRRRRGVLPPQQQHQGRLPRPPPPPLALREGLVVVVVVGFWRAWKRCNRGR